MKRYNQIIALVVALVPCLGQFYNRQYNKAIYFGLTMLISFVLIGITDMLLNFTGLVIATVGILVLYLFMIANAFSQAKNRHIKIGNGKKLQLGFAMIVVIGVFYVFGCPSVRSEIIGVSAYYYPSGASMQPTIQGGDFVMLHLKAFEKRSPQKGEIVVFKHPDYGYLLTKRVIAVSGEMVSGNGIDVFVNDEHLNEPYALYSEDGKLQFGPITVPQGKFFVMGDNRDDSRDSRDVSFGFLDPKMLIGKPLYVYWAHDTKRVGTRLE